MSYKALFTGYPAFPYVYAFWQVRRTATMNVRTTWYLRNGLRYLNQIWHVDVARYYFQCSSIWRQPPAWIFIKTPISPEQYKISSLSVCHITCFHNVPFLVTLILLPFGSQVPKNPLREAWYVFLIQARENLKVTIVCSFKASNQICTKFGDLKWVATVIAGHPAVQYSLASWEHAVHAHLPSHLWL